MDYPEYIEIENKKYPINTDFRVALECNRISEDKTIGRLESALAIIYLLFGEEALNDEKHYEELGKLAEKYLLCGKEKEKSKEKPDMDFEEDMDYIEASFQSDFGIDLSNVKMHWWKFMKLMNGLSNSEIGNCCILNRIRNLRNYDTKDIKDRKEKQKVEELKKKFELKKYRKEVHHTKEQRESVNELLQKLNLRKE